MVNLFDNPAEAKFIQTYTPMNFEGIKNLAIQAKDDRDKSVDAFGALAASGVPLGSWDDRQNEYYDNRFIKPITELSEEISATQGMAFNDPAMIGKIHAITNAKNSSEAKQQQQFVKSGWESINTAPDKGFAGWYAQERASEGIDKTTGKGFGDINPLPDNKNLDADMLKLIDIEASKTMEREGANYKGLEFIDQPRVTQAATSLADSGVMDVNLKEQYNFDKRSVETGRIDLSQSPLNGLGTIGEDGKFIPTETSYRDYKIRRWEGIAQPEIHSKEDVEMSRRGGSGNKTDKEEGGNSWVVITTNDMTMGHKSTVPTFIKDIPGSEDLFIDSETGYIENGDALHTAYSREAEKAKSIVSSSSVDVATKKQTLTDVANASRSYIPMKGTATVKIGELTGLTVEEIKVTNNNSGSQTEKDKKKGSETYKGSTTDVTTKYDVSYKPMGANTVIFTPQVAMPRTNDDTEAGKKYNKDISQNGTYVKGSGGDQFRPSNASDNEVRNRINRDMILAYMASYVGCSNIKLGSALTDIPVGGSSTHLTIPADLKFSANDIRKMYADMKQGGKFGNHVTKLKEMGFSNVENIIQNLIATNPNGYTVSTYFQPDISKKSVQLAIDGALGYGNVNAYNRKETTTYREDPAGE